jgi:uncharacterized membrane protein YidH (DUF202 family)
MNRTLGIVLVIVGVILLIGGTVGFKTRKKVLDIGPIEATKTTTHYVPYAPILGGAIAVVGAVLIARRD